MQLEMISLHKTRMWLIALLFLFSFTQVSLAAGTTIIPENVSDAEIKVAEDQKDTEEVKRLEIQKDLADKFKTGKFELYDIGTYIQYLIEFLIYIAGGIAVLFVVIGGYKYMIGSVSDDKEAGKKTIAYALAGFAIAVLAWTVVNFIQVWLTSGGVEPEYTHYKVGEWGEWGECNENKQNRNRVVFAYQSKIAPAENEPEAEEERTCQTYYMYSTPNWSLVECVNHKKTYEYKETAKGFISVADAKTEGYGERKTQKNEEKACQTYYKHDCPEWDKIACKDGKRTRECKKEEKEFAGLGDAEASGYGAQKDPSTEEECYPYIVSDSNFRPKHGFSFSNWGGDPSMTIEGMKTVFGEALVCNGGNCTTPAAEKWLQKKNAGMEGGHCYGMAIYSMVLYGSGGDAHSLSKSEAAGTISTYFVLQGLEPVRSFEKNMKNKDIDEMFSFMKKEFDKGNPCGLGLRSKQGGHEVTAYALKDLGEGKYHILIYENNRPDQERYIEVDKNTGKWTYSLAATEPSQDPSPWSGMVAGSLDTVDIATIKQKPECPFCASGSSLGADILGGDRIEQMNISASFGVELLITDQYSRRIGHPENGEFINEIPGAERIFISGAVFDKELQEEYFIPADLELTIEMRLRDSSLLQDAEVSLFSPGTAYSLENIKVSNGERNVLGVDLSEDSFVFKSSQPQEVMMSLATDAPGPDHLMEFENVSLDYDGMFAMDVNRSDGSVEIAASNQLKENYKLRIVRYDDNGKNEILDESAVLPQGAATKINYESLTDEKVARGRVEEIEIISNNNSKIQRLLESEEPQTIEVEEIVQEAQQPEKAVEINIPLPKDEKVARGRVEEIEIISNNNSKIQRLLESEEPQTIEVEEIVQEAQQPEKAVEINIPLPKDEPEEIFTRKVVFSIAGFLLICLIGIFVWKARKEAKTNDKNSSDFR
jgi:hypothetical protein